MLDSTTAKKIDELYQLQLNSIRERITKSSLSIAKVLMAKRLNEIIETVNSTDCSNVRLILQYYYGNMIDRDWLSLDIDVLKDYATHASMLLESSIIDADISDEVFLNYIAYYRINNESIKRCRSIFYEECADIANIIDPLERAMQVNIWCSSYVTYKSSDIRTMASIDVWRTGYGRCGEESTFCVNVLRSLGIPARQVYVPFWSHCDDNHAWVEFYVRGKWYYYGACEPEVMPNRGWFNNAAARAMLVHSRSFGRIYPESECDNIISHHGIMTLYNETNRYTDTKELEFILRTGEEELDLYSSISANIRLYVVNYGGLYELANIVIDDSNSVIIRVGIGDLIAYVSVDASVNRDSQINCLYSGYMIIKGQQNGVITITPEALIPIRDINVNMKDVIIECPCDINSEYPVINADKLIDFAKDKEKAKYIRSQRINNAVEVVSYDVSNAEYPAMLCIDTLDLLQQQIYRNLCDKDQLDISVGSLKYYANSIKNHIIKQEESVGIYNPRIKYEEITESNLKVLSEIANYMCNGICDVMQLKEFICNNIKLRAEDISANQAPADTILLGEGTEDDIGLAYMALKRELRIESNKDNISNNYSAIGRNEKLDQSDSTIKLTLLKKPNDIYEYGIDLVIAKVVGNNIINMINDMNMVKWNDDRFELSVPIGQYLITTTIRLPNGNIAINAMSIYGECGENIDIALCKPNISLEDIYTSIMLPNIELEIYAVNQTISLNQLVKKGFRFFIWIEAHHEPSEHILNELIEIEKLHDTTKGILNIAIVLQHKEDIYIPTLQILTKLNPSTEILVDSNHTMEVLARRVYREARYPLIIAVNEFSEAVYSTSGYNVGVGAMMMKINKLFFSC